MFFAELVQTFKPRHRKDQSDKHVPIMVYKVKKTVLFPAFPSVSEKNSISGGRAFFSSPHGWRI